MKLRITGTCSERDRAEDKDANSIIIIITGVHVFRCVSSKRAHQPTPNTQPRFLQINAEVIDEPYRSQLTRAVLNPIHQHPKPLGSWLAPGSKWQEAEGGAIFPIRHTDGGDTPDVRISFDCFLIYTGMLRREPEAGHFLGRLHTSVNVGRVAASSARSVRVAHTICLTRELIGVHTRNFHYKAAPRGPIAQTHANEIAGREKQEREREKNSHTHIGGYRKVAMEIGQQYQLHAKNLWVRLNQPHEDERAMVEEEKTFTFFHLLIQLFLLRRR